MFVPIRILVVYTYTDYQHFRLEQFDLTLGVAWPFFHAKPCQNEPQRTLHVFSRTTCLYDQTF